MAKDFPNSAKRVKTGEESIYRILVALMFETRFDVLPWLSMLEGQLSRFAFTSFVSNHQLQPNLLPPQKKSIKLPQILRPIQNLKNHHFTLHLCRGIIEGVKYHRELLDKAEAAAGTAGKDGSLRKLSLADAADLWEDAGDGGDWALRSWGFKGYLKG